MSETTPGKCLSPLNKLLNIIKSLKSLYDSKPFLKKLNLLLPLEDTIDIKSFLLMQIQLLEKKLFMLESLPLNKKKIWIHKLNLLNKNFLNTEKNRNVSVGSSLYYGANA